MAGTYKSRLGASAPDRCYRARNVAHGTHPVRPGDVGTGVELDQLGEVNARGKVRVHGIRVGSESISGQLKHSFRSRTQIAHKFPRAVGIAVSDVVRDDEFGLRVQGQPRPHRSPFLRGVVAQPLLVATDQRMNFISLDKIRLDAAHKDIQQALALVPRADHQIENRADVQPRNAGDRTHAHAFHHQLKRARSRVDIGVMGFEPFNRLGESSFAGLAAPPLDSALTEVTKLFALLVLALEAGHTRRCFLADVAVESAWVGIAAQSACRLPRLSIGVDGGAFRWGERWELNPFAPVFKTGADTLFSIRPPQTGAFKDWRP